MKNPCWSKIGSWVVMAAFLVGCGGPTAAPPPTVTVGGDQPIATLPPLAPMVTVEPAASSGDMPGQPAAPVALGAPGVVGLYTVVVHDVREATWMDPQLFGDAVAEQRLFVDLSIRNDGPQYVSQVWSREHNFAIVALDGTALNSEWAELAADGGAGVGLMPPALQSPECGGDGGRAGRTLPFFDDLTPGQVSRGWINFRLTPGVADAGNLLAVQLKQPDGATLPPILFSLAGTPNEAALPWATTPAQPEATVTLEALVLSEATALPPAEPVKLLGWEACPVATRDVTVKVKNTSARSVRFGSVAMAMDAGGRVYWDMGRASRVELGPQEEGVVTFTFLAILGLEEPPVALLFGPAPGSQERIRLAVTE